MNLVFWTTIATLLLGVAVHRRIHLQHHSSQASPPTPDSLPLPADTTWPIAPERWSIDTVEFLASQNHVRAVVSVTFPSTQDASRRQCLQLLSAAIYRHTEVQAVFVEVSGVEDAPQFYLFAPDGRGW